MDALQNQPASKESKRQCLVSKYLPKPLLCTNLMSFSVTVCFVTERAIAEHF